MRIEGRHTQSHLCFFKGKTRTPLTTGISSFVAVRMMGRTMIWSHCILPHILMPHASAAAVAERPQVERQRSSRGSHEGLLNDSFDGSRWDRSGVLGMHGAGASE